MPKEWYQRLWLVLAVVLGSIYLLLPTFLIPAEDTSTTSVGVDATPVPTEGASLRSATGTSGMMTATAGTAGTATASAPKAKKRSGRILGNDKRLRLGLDLVGGSHLSLGVDTDEALRTMIASRRRELKERLEKEGIAFNAVTQPIGTATLVVSLKNGGDREKLSTFIEKKFDSNLEEAGFQEKEGAFLATFKFDGEFERRLENDAVGQVENLMRQRMNAFGVSEPVVYREQADRIVVELPGLKDPGKAITEIKRTARLEFHIVDEDFYRQRGGDGGATGILQQLVTEALATLGPTASDDQINAHIHKAGLLPEESAIFWEKTLTQNKVERGRPWLLKREIALTGDRLEDAFPTTDQFQRWEVSIRFDPAGAERFAEVTGANVNRRMAIVLESAVQPGPPNIQERIDGGSARITLGGDSNAQDRGANRASEISRVLKTGALPAPVRIEQNRTVGPSLGQDAIRKGVQAMLAGMILVFAFAIVWYEWSGVIAVITLIANSIIILGVMTLFDATLTLPGIAGIILTIGMAVDANVLIYERIREELRVGKAIRPAVDAGFDKAFSSILDGNLTTAAAGIVLYFYGTEQIKGFAVTLLIGIGTTLFCALVITRLLLDWYTISRKPARLSI